MGKRIPTLEDYKNYDGAHCAQLWNSLGDTWHCPACGRSKFEIMRWTKRRWKAYVGKCDPYDDWMAGFHKHHDHSVPLIYPRPDGRFPTLIICDQCNSADGVAKRKLGLPEDFSFSPEEIRQFVTSEPHGKHKINFDIARKIYLALFAC
jgi:hypothetical protein